MRITNKVIQNNSISNINSNKVLQDKLNNQMSTEKKINRPSDDPIIAIRALRLRTNVAQVTQYYEKNIPDAESWMQITEDSLTTVSDVLTDVIEQCTKGTSEKLTTTDRQTILDNIRQLHDEVYATGNADNAGRSVFTGYRTETTLMFTKGETKKYSITEQLHGSDLSTVKYINSRDINNINEVNFNTAEYNNTVEQNIEENEIYRMRLAYSNLDGEAGLIPQISTYDVATDSYVPFNTAANTEVISVNDDPSPYQILADYDKANEEAIAAGNEPVDRYVLIPDTGELLMTKSAYQKLMNLKDDIMTSATDESEIQITYQKSIWDKGDLRPEHYFACTDQTEADPAAWVYYNQDYLRGLKEKQSIEYDVGLNQSIRVNTTADEVFAHAIGRDVDDMISSMQDVVDMEATIERLKSIRSGYSENDSEYSVINNQVDAAEKALTFLKEKCQKCFENNITNMQKHLDNVNYATTNCGTREMKLDLVKNRLMSQKTNFETLQSDNEDVDLTDVAIQLSGAELTYQAALMSVGKIMQTSLMNYI
ncbi:MAG: hypothetical protein K5662_00390 [Lachnospiraceae bacterium]|nr:hypothetical protein [Lachnospiraceae bacterium]